MTSFFMLAFLTIVQPVATIDPHTQSDNPTLQQYLPAINFLDVTNSIINNLTLPERIKLQPKNWA